MKIKMSTVNWSYCKPKALDAVINDFRRQAGSLHVAIVPMYNDFVPSANITRWACIGVKRCDVEYKVILNYYQLKREVTK